MEWSCKQLGHPDWHLPASCKVCALVQEVADEVHPCTTLHHTGSKKQAVGTGSAGMLTKEHKAEETIPLVGVGECLSDELDDGGSFVTASEQCVVGDSSC